MDNSINQGGTVVNSIHFDYRLIDVYNQPQRVDEASSGTTYIGWIDDYGAGVNETEPRWRIKKITVIGTVTKFEYADGNPAFDNVWSDRDLLDYR